MQLLRDKIQEHGTIQEGNILKVDSFLNHQIDTKLLNKMADEFISLFDTQKVNKVLTVETSGISIAFPVADKLNVPLVIAKKTDSINLAGDDVYSTKIISYTHFREYDVILSKKYLKNTDHVLIFDDFLANGSSLKGLLSLTQQAGAFVEGIGVAIEKTYDRGGQLTRGAGYNVQSLVKISEIDYKNNKMVFV